MNSYFGVRVKGKQPIRPDIPLISAPETTHILKKKFALLSVSPVVVLYSERSAVPFGTPGCPVGTSRRDIMKIAQRFNACLYPQVEECETRLAKRLWTQVLPVRKPRRGGIG
jgi:hypothetical protein